MDRTDPSAVRYVQQFELHQCAVTDRQSDYSMSSAG